MNPIIDEDYGDFLVEYTGKKSQIPSVEGAVLERYNASYGILHVPLSQVETLSFLGYEAIPAWYGPMGFGELNEIGALTVRNQPFLQLTGRGVLVGIADGGIDYQREEFRYPDGTSRIRVIWDQTRESAVPPAGLGYGTVYEKAQIDEALRTGNPLSEIPVEDPDGHGTYLAAVAAGSDLGQAGSGAAPDSELVVVCLKPMKQYLRTYYQLPENVRAYQETDLMNAIRFIKGISWWYDLPVSILMGLGSSLGAHIGVGIFEQILGQTAETVGTPVHFPAGNEGNVAHHFFGVLDERSWEREMELQIGEGEEGIFFEIWGENPFHYRLEVSSPEGERLSFPFVYRITEMEESFLLNDTIIRITSYPLTSMVGKPLITVGMDRPEAGIWQFTVVGSGPGSFHSWLPVQKMIGENTYFLRPDPDEVITEPANVHNVISMAGYDIRTGSVIASSGRGYTPEGRIKPDLAAPGGIAEATVTPGDSAALTGTSTAAAFAAGTSALLLQWAIVDGNNPRITGIAVKNQLIRGAARNEGEAYPNRRTGYGKLDIYGAIRSLRG